MNLVFTGAGQLLEKSLRRAGKGGLQGYAGGQFIPTALWHGEQRRAADALPRLLGDFDREMQFLRRVYEQNVALSRIPETFTSGVDLVPLSDIEGQIQVCIRNYYARSFVLGKRAAGNLLGANEADLERLGELRRDEYSYLSNFLRAIQDGAGKLPYDQRMHWYSMAAREIYNLGFVWGDTSEKRWIEWVVGDTEQNCRDCNRFAAHGPYRIDAFIEQVVRHGYVPQSGKLSCKGYHCKCRLRHFYR